MTQADDKTAQRNEIKAVFKEALDEWRADQEKTRTAAAEKEAADAAKNGGKSRSLFGALGELFS